MPDAVRRLKRFVVDLAVCGRLSMEKEYVPEIEGLGGHKCQSTPIIESELPFSDVPLNRYARLAQLARIEKGTTGIQKATPGKYPLVTLGESRASCDSFQFDGRAAVIPLISSSGHGHASVKRLHYQEGKFALANILCAVIPYDARALSARFLYEYFTAYKEFLFVSKMIGTANVSLTVTKIAATPVPLIGRNCQKRADQLFMLCDELQAAQVRRELRRDRVVAAILHNLTNGKSVSGSSQSARFYLHHLSRLTTRCEHIKQLRQKIIDLAVRGNLVAQNPDEGLGTRTLETARRSRDRLVVERGLRREQELEFSEPPNLPTIPSTWSWVRLGDVALVQGGKRLPQGASFSLTPTPHIYIRVTDMKEGTISTTDLKHITPTVQRFIAKYTINKEDLYITIAGTIGEVGRVPDFFDGHNLTENAAKIVFRDIDPEFLRLVLSSDLVQGQFREKTKQMAQPKLALKRIAGAKFPLPPIAEQHRIVERVHELMSLCTDLAHQLDDVGITRQSFLEATLDATLKSASAVAV